MDLGINLSPVNDYNREWVFSDVFTQSREWRLVKGTVVQPPSVKVPVKADGYPDFTAVAAGDAVQSMMLVDMDGHYPKGVYNASWSGDSTGVSFRGQGLTVGPFVKDATGRWTTTLDLQGDKGFVLELRGANVSDMRVLVPNDKGQIFHPMFVAPLASFKHIRFLNWMNTNAVRKAHTWAERTKPQSVRQSYQPQGVCLEAMIFLCNQTKTRPWFCMPHLFDDDYVRRFATMVKKQCRADKIYVEFSNETWNPDFPVYAWAKAEATRLGIIWPYVIADNAKRVWDIWLSVFGDQSSKIVRVVGGQTSNDWVASNVLKRLNYGADAIAVGSYFGVPKETAATFGASTTPQEVLAAARTTLPRLRDGIKKHQSIKAGIPVLVYEGGQHILGDDAWFNAAYDAQILPEMYDATIENLQQAANVGVTAFTAFAYVSRRDSQYGSWGHFEGQEQVALNPSSLRAQAPKAAALRDFIGL